jgi:hypothetical protein
MKNVIIVSTIFLLISCAGNKSQGISGMPPCMITKIEGMKSNPEANQPQSVTQYSYKGAAVFYITAGCCDQFNTVYNSDCDYLGAPDGGITGKGDGKLNDFFVNATNKKVVWENK